MKYLYIFFILPFLVSSYTHNNNADAVNWTTDFDNAKEIAKNEDKNILVYFTGSDWCGPCIKLKKDLFVKDRFIALSQGYVMLYIDIPRKKSILTPEQLEHNMTLLPKLNKKGVFPHFTILDSQERILDELSGYNMDGKVERHLKFFEKNK